ncbi:hypothetical protein GCM10017691_61460 [Pseudonocardia petroleophila]|uniref:ABC-type Mn/Zn transport systems, ATPase component n=1 Tax=Pseudonocardia petroleophila TaxID=37331 RepID=A0A7G7MM67_9PSEU|nr:hypothetical protein [Pseudonocardia petroleophila]QNG53878.1 hypothetical protein H6H00_08155 [Pseudonocardia petroleophila]
MSNDNTLVRSLHDLGLSAWFGGSLMGAVGVNGAADDVHDPTERLRVASSGWARWAPVNAAAIGVHLIGAVGMLSANRERVRREPGVGTSSAVKTALTVASLGATAYSGWLGSRTAKGVGAPAAGGVTPSSGTPDDVADAQRQLRVVQWVLPLLTGALVVVSALQGEQQRPRVRAGALARSIQDRVAAAV